jgi:hypothetical protein
VKELASRIDRRIIAFEVLPDITEKQVILKGFVHFPHQRKVLLKKISEIPIVMKRKIPVRSRLKILSQQKKRFAQVRVPFGRLRKEPIADSELGTDVLFGYYVVCYFTKGKYWFCADPTGYMGYIHRDEIIEKSSREYLAWLNGFRGRILKNLTIGDLFIPMGSEFICTERERVMLPNGKKLRLDKKSLFSYKPGENKKISLLLKRAHTFLKTPYLWGGNTIRGIDCSGFIQEVFLQYGIALPRDSSQQIGYGRQVGILGDFSDLLPGDLIFFMGRENRIVHVGISLGGNRLIHALIKAGITVTSIEELHLGKSFFLDTYVFGRRIFF